VPPGRCAWASGHQDRRWRGFRGAEEAEQLEHEEEEGRICGRKNVLRGSLEGARWGKSSGAGVFVKLLLFFDCAIGNVGGFYSEIALRNEKQRAQCILNTS
jgi:hypothetical protein